MVERFVPGVFRGKPAPFVHPKMCKGVAGFLLPCPETCSRGATTAFTAEPWRSTHGEILPKRQQGTRKSGPGGKGGPVKSRKQAIAIGLSEARAKGKKVPARKKTAAKDTGARRKTATRRKTA